MTRQFYSLRFADLLQRFILLGRLLWPHTVLIDDPSQSFLTRLHFLTVIGLGDALQDFLYFSLNLSVSTNLAMNINGDSCP